MATTYTRCGDRGCKRRQSPTFYPEQAYQRTEPTGAAPVLAKSIANRNYERVTDVSRKCFWCQYGLVNSPWQSVGTIQWTCKACQDHYDWLWATFFRQDLEADGGTQEVHG